MTWPEGSSPALSQDAWEMQEFITHMYVKNLLRHPAFQLLLAVLLVVNAITIALRTNSFLGQVRLQPNLCPHWPNKGLDRAFCSQGVGLFICS